LLSDAGRDPSGELRPGQKVSVPDLRILEKRYGHVIPKLPAGGEAPAPRKTEFDVKPAAEASPGTGPTYQVRAQGRTRREAARLPRGEGERGGELSRLPPPSAPGRPLRAAPPLGLPGGPRAPAAAP